MLTSCRAQINATRRNAPCLTIPKRTDIARNTSGRAGQRVTANTANANGRGMAVNTRKSSLTIPCRNRSLSCTTSSSSTASNNTPHQSQDSAEPLGGASCSASSFSSIGMWWKDWGWQVKQAILGWVIGSVLGVAIILILKFLSQ